MLTSMENMIGREAERPNGLSANDILHWSCFARAHGPIRPSSDWLITEKRRPIWEHSVHFGSRSTVLICRLLIVCLQIFVGDLVYFYYVFIQ